MDELQSRRRFFARHCVTKATGEIRERGQESGPRMRPRGLASEIIVSNFKLDAGQHIGNDELAR
jgi:hypothetical protein